MSDTEGPEKKRQKLEQDEVHITDERKLREYEDEVDQQIKQAIRPRRRRELSIDEKQAMDEKVEELLKKMDQAADEDNQLNAEGKPAIKKNSILKIVVHNLAKRGLQEAFLLKGVLITLRRWLQPLPDRSLPNEAIRTKLLRALLNFEDIDSIHLKESGIGSVVMFLSRHPYETQENKKVAQRLIHEWSRPIYQLDSQYTRVSDAVSSSVPRVVQSRSYSKDDDYWKELADSNPKTAGNTKPRLRAQIPQPASMDYKTVPEQEIVVSRKVVPSETRTKLMKRLQEMKKKNVKTKSSKISVEGRNM